MSAICGIINRDRGVDEGVLRKMTDIMDYRGPDNNGFFIKENIGLGHRCLSVNNNTIERQPFSNEGNNLFLVCDGTIYNSPELRKMLEEKGHRFKSNSDNETILHLYEEKGVECLNVLRGAFAFAIWDNREKQLFLARDRIGQKPLLYSESPDGLIFASEIKALLLYPAIKKEIDLSSLDMFLTYQAVPSPNTIFKGIKKLPSSCYLIWQAGKTKDTVKYWNINFSNKIKLETEDEYAELLWSKLVEATKLQMTLDIPQGVFLSGGIDSSSITGIMSLLSHQPIKTFSIGFNEKNFDELKYAKLVSDRFSTEHHQFIVKPDMMDILPRLIWHYNEPFADASMIPLYYLAREAKTFVTVAFNGDGADENLAGYTRYWQMLLMKDIESNLSIIPPVIKKWLMAPFIEGYKEHPNSMFFKICKWMDDTQRYGDVYAYGKRLISFTPEYKEKVYSDFFKSETRDTNAFAPVKLLWEESRALNLLEKMLYTDIHLYLADILTVKMDIASMSNALETRSPFLDHQFVETVASFPSELKFKKKIPKYILKKRLKGVLSDEIIYRKKLGFGLPIGEWFRKELKDYLCSYLLSDGFSKGGFFNPESVKTMVYQHISGKQRHTTQLWNLLVFECWYRIFIMGEKL